MRVKRVPQAGSTQASGENFERRDLVELRRDRAGAGFEPRLDRTQLRQLRLELLLPELLARAELLAPRRGARRLLGAQLVYEHLLLHAPPGVELRRGRDLDGTF